MELEPERALDRLVRELGKEKVLTGLDETLVYETDSSNLMGEMPLAIVTPTSVEEVSKVLKICDEEGVPIVPRGSGTDLMGGAVPASRGVILSLSKLNRVLDLDLDDSCVVVESGIITASLSEVLTEHGFFYAPDPSSKDVCTIGGNIAHNAGGPHCLKYGVTSNNVLGMEVVLPSGKVVRLGGKALDPPGYDLQSLFYGSEGTLGVVTKAYLKLTRVPEARRTLLAAFKDVEDAGRAVSEIIGSGIIPGALELIDKASLDSLAVYSPDRFPKGMDAVLIIEVEGYEKVIDRMAERVVEICKKNNVSLVKVAESEEERESWWKGREETTGALGIYAPTFLDEDVSVPRSKIPETLRRLYEIAKAYNVIIASVAHIGDGNFHPAIPFDPKDEDSKMRAFAAERELLKVCVEMGGSITGEHGVGLSKKEFMGWMYGERELELMKRIKKVFDPKGILNPGKIFPSEKGD